MALIAISISLSALDPRGRQSWLVEGRKAETSLHMTFLQGGKPPHKAGGFLTLLVAQGQSCMVGLIHDSTPPNYKKRAAEDPAREHANSVGPPTRGLPERAGRPPC